MKNQYFADKNDYLKYGLLRILVGNGEMKLACCWMLTPNGSNSDGIFIKYLDDPKNWKDYDPVLFDSLYSCIKEGDIRSVSWAKEKRIIPNATYYEQILEDKKGKRHAFFQDFFHQAENSNLIFFDPDNGIEVKSTPYGKKNSNKYIYWSELANTFGLGKSVLVYQHFAREKRDTLINRLVHETSERLGVRELFSLRTSHVLFLLIPQLDHLDYLSRKSIQINALWINKIQVVKHEF